LKFPNKISLPTRLRGHTFKLGKSDIIDWKAIRKEMKLLRKKFKKDHGLIVSWEQLSILVRWLTITFDEKDD